MDVNWKARATSESVGTQARPDREVVNVEGRSRVSGKTERRPWPAVALLGLLWLGGRVLVAAQDPAAAPPQQAPPSDQPAPAPPASPSDDDDLLAGGDDKPASDKPASDQPASDADSLLTGDDSLLDDSAVPAETEPAEEAEPEVSAAEEHEKVFLENRYPSANTCATCHPSSTASGRSRSTPTRS